MKKDLKLLCAIYLHHFHSKKIERILENDSEEVSSQKSIVIRIDQIQLCFSALIKCLNENTIRAIDLLQIGCDAVQTFLLKRNPNLKKQTILVHIIASASHPVLCLNRCEGFGEQQSMIGRLCVLKARVVKLTPSKLVQTKSWYRCRECQHTFCKEAEFEQYYALQMPKLCPSSDACGSKVFEEIILNDENFLSLCKVYQEVSVTEMEISPKSLIPRRMTIILENDLADRCQISDIITVSGILRQRWSSLTKTQAPKIELVLFATWITKLNDESTLQSNESPLKLEETLMQKFDAFWRYHAANPLRGRDIILAAVCDDLYQMYLVKMALLLCLIGGVGSISSTGTTIRGDPHLLLIGDPGTGKSKLLRFASKVAKRSVYSTGVGTTSAGLTCAAVRVDGQWHAEPGALPLSNGGVCCIDEFHTLSDCDKASVREAMETQGLSVAKAGIKTVLPCHCAVLAAMNPGKFTKTGDAPLYSRFDLILTLNADYSGPANHDTKVAKFLAAKFCSMAKKCDAPEKNCDTMPKKKPFFDAKMLKNYIAVVKKKLKPKMTPEAEKILSQYYAMQRQKNATNRDDGKTTNRLRDALIRFAQAHARLMYSNTVQSRDAIVAVLLMDCSMPGSELFETIDILHTVFPKDTKTHFDEISERILTRLNLSELLPSIFLVKNEPKELEMPTEFSENDFTKIRDLKNLEETVETNEYEEKLDENVVNCSTNMKRNVTVCDEDEIAQSNNVNFKLKKFRFGGDY